MNEVVIRKSSAEIKESLFEVFWKIYPKRPNNNKKQALRQWLARMKQGADPAEIIDGTARYARYCKAENLEPRFIRLAATFIGRDEHYLLEWEVQESKADSFDRWLTGNTGDEDGIIDI